MRKWIQPSITQEKSSFATWEEFKTAIHRVFGEIDAKEVTRVKYMKIEQGARSTALYWAEFQNIIADLDYNNSTYMTNSMPASQNGPRLSSRCYPQNRLL